MGSKEQKQQFLQYLYFRGEKRSKEKNLLKDPNIMRKT